MVDYRRGAHTVFEMHLHLVWITKYRRPALSGEVATSVGDLIRDICAQQEVNIMKGHVAKDHVHLFVSIPPQVTISRRLQWLKGKTAHHLMAEFPPHQEAVLGTAHRGQESLVQLLGNPCFEGEVRSRDSCAHAGHAF